MLEPWLEGSSLGALAAALDDRPRRLLGIGTAAAELRRYGTAAQHEAAHGLDAASVTARIRAWASPSPTTP